MGCFFIKKNQILHDDVIIPNLCYVYVHTQLNTGNKNCFHGEEKRLPCHGKKVIFLEINTSSLKTQSLEITPK